MFVAVIGDNGKPREYFDDFESRFVSRKSGIGVVVEKRAVYGLASVIGCLIGDAIDVNCGISYVCGFFVEYWLKYKSKIFNRLEEVVSVLVFDVAGIRLLLEVVEYTSDDCFVVRVVLGICVVDENIVGFVVRVNGCVTF